MCYWKRHEKEKGVGIRKDKQNYNTLFYRCELKIE